MSNPNTPNKSHATKHDTPSSRLFNVVRIWTKIIALFILVLLIASGIFIYNQATGSYAPGTNVGAAVFALIILGIFVPFGVAGIVAVIPLIISIVAANKLSWKIQPYERFEMVLLGVLAILGLWFLPSLLKLIG